MAHEGAQVPLVGFVVSRSVGGAVVRNAVKRRLRAVVAERLSLLGAGERVVVRAKPESASAPASVLARDFESALAGCRRAASAGASRSRATRGETR